MTSARRPKDAAPKDQVSPAMPRTVDEAVEMERSDRAMRFLFFWNSQRGNKESPGHGCLSQWWQEEFTSEGHIFRSAEHYMMAHKAWLFNDAETAKRILAAPHPGEAKSLGRQVQGFEEDMWHEHRYGIVLRGSIAKFSQSPEIRDFLLSTHKRVLVEASPLDRIWGIGLAADDERALSPASWKGLNLLGFALMEAREVLISR